MQFRPLRAAKIDDTSAIIPLLAKWHELFLSVKLDGIRVLNIDGVLYTRKLELIPSKYLQEKFGGLKNHGLDGEMICGSATAENVFHRTQSAVMSEDSDDAINCRWIIYDNFQLGHENYGYRYKETSEICSDDSSLVLMPQKIITSFEQFIEFEEKAVQRGFEGVMGRTGSLDWHEAIYKHGDATLKEGFLWKFKRWFDTEAELTGFEEQLANKNAAMVDALGKTKRSSAKAGKVGKGCVGKLIGRVLATGEIIKVGTGLTNDLRQKIWDKPDEYIGQSFTFKQQLAGRKNAPRFAVFKSFRDNRDILEI